MNLNLFRSLGLDLASGTKQSWRALPQPVVGKIGDVLTTTLQWKTSINPGKDKEKSDP